MGRTLKYVLPLLFVVGLGACDGLGTSPEAPVTVVESYFISGEPLADIRLTRTAPVNAAYYIVDQAIPDAQVQVSRVGADGSANATWMYTFDAAVGYYRAPEPAATVEASTTYRLSAVLSDGSEVSAATTVPGDFEIRRLAPTTVTYQSAEQVEVDVTRSVVANRQAIFVFSVESLDPSVDALTPLYAEFVGDDEEDLDQVLITESPPINEQNYDVNSDGTLTIRLPWVAVAFYGPNRIIASAVDDNLYDFLRSQQIQQGGSTFSPGEIPNVIDHVSGGTGLFGSLSRVSAAIQVDR